MMRRIALWCGVLALLVVNVLVQLHYSTTIWPYLWPQPALFVLLTAAALLLWFPGLMRGIWALRLAGLLMLVVGQSYLIHSINVTIHAVTLTSAVHLVGMVGAFTVMALGYVNQIMPRNRSVAPSLPADLPFVAVVVPTYGEPLDVLEATVASITRLDYPAERVYVLVADDGRRAEVGELCERYGVHSIHGPQRDAKAGNLNAALDHLAQHAPQATLILTQDADELLDSSFLRKTVGYFNDPQIAFVQTPKDAFTPERDPFGNRDRIFYDILQPGRNGANAAFSCGSGVIWRIAAVRSVGGFATWNLVEDLTTSYYLHSAGYRSEYHNETLTIGLSPDDIPGLLKQRGTWAADTWRLFLFDNPLLKRGLSLRQRLQYLELGMFYVCSAFFMPLLLLTPVLSLARSEFIPLEGAALFPWIGASMVYYLVLSRGNLLFLRRMWQYWVGHAPTYLWAFWLAVRSRNRKPRYQVTRKTRQNGFYGRLIWPQYVYMGVGSVLVVRALYFMEEVNLATRLANSALLLFFMLLVSQICRASLYGVELGSLRGLAQRARGLAQHSAGITRQFYQTVFSLQLNAIFTPIADQGSHLLADAGVQDSEPAGQLPDVVFSREVGAG
jgi:cellulose synthase (UDP-forming)